MWPARVIGCAIMGAVCAASSPRARATDSAGQPVHRCVGRNGEIVFSGLACSADEAAIAPAPSTSAGATPMQPPACATSPANLRERIAATVAVHDPNALAGLLSWRGVSGGVAEQRMRALRTLVKGPLIAIDSDDSGADPATRDAAAPSVDSPDIAPDATQLRVRTGSNQDDGARDHTFGIRIDGGCYWLDW